MRRWWVVLGVLAGCGDDGGVLVEVSQSAAIQEEITKLHLFVGTPDEVIGNFAGTGRPGDQIELGAPLGERHHTIQLLQGDGMSSETPVRIAVLGKAGSDPVGLGVLDLPGIPDAMMLRYDLILEPVGEVATTETGCLILPDGTVVAAIDDRDCDGWETPEDCDDLDPQTHPEAYDACKDDRLGIDDDCNDTIDDGDLDEDGANCLRDCADDDPDRTPGNVEDCSDGVDADCDDRIDEGIPEICDDAIDNDCDADTPDGSTVEICGDGYDNDCDDAVDEGRDGDPDVDGDGFDCAADCDDDDFFVNPDADEICNDADDDCDDAFDEGVNTDGDPALCIDDCDDFEEHAYPNNNEVCDGIDNDCVETTAPGPLPCLTDLQDPCVYGFRDCDEQLGLYGLVCEPGEGEDGQIADVCDQFATCGTTQEGLACAGEPTHRCGVMVATETHEVCGGAQMPMVAPGDPASCQWFLLGGTIQQGWQVGLVDVDNPSPSPTSMACSIDFRVVSVPDGLQPGQFVVMLIAGGDYSHAEVLTIVPEPSNLCALPSLTCAATGGG